MIVLTGFSDLIGQPVVKEVLKHWIQTHQTPHALLFTGPEGIGKKTTAILLAKTLLCKSPSQAPCNSCSSCKKMDALGHPDFWQISVMEASKKGEITIDQIREDILDGLFYHPFEGDTRVVLISDAHKMNSAAANALLKALEEPPLGTYFILTTFSASALSSTIQSRCQKLRFVPFVGDALEKFWAKKNPDLSLENLHFLSLLSPQNELGKETDNSAQVLLNRVLFLAQRLVEITSMPIQKKLALAEYLGENRKQALQDIDIWTYFIREAAIFPIRPTKAEMKPVTSILKPLTKVSPKYLFQAADALLSAKRQIMGNTSPRLCLEKLFLTLSNVLREPIANS